MQANQFAINFTTDQVEAMKAFYHDTLGLAPMTEMGDGAFATGGGAVIFIDGHSETHGPAKEPQRVLVDFFVNDAETERKALEAKGVKFIRKEGKEYWGGVVSTFLDPDGNYCQLLSMAQQ